MSKRSGESEVSAEKKGLPKRSQLIIALILALIAVMCGAGTGIFFALTSYTLDTPVVSVSYSGEPDYLINLAWAPVDKAVSYTIEYSYNYFPGQTYTINVKTTSFSVKRIKGGFTYNVRAIGERARNDSRPANAKILIPGLEFDSLNIFNVTESGGAYKIDYNTFEPVRYVYKGKEYEVPFYEAVMIPAGASEQEKVIKFAEPDVWFTEDIQQNTFNFTAGEWKIYVRPVLYYLFFEERTVPEEYEYLDQLYSPGEYTVVTVTVG